MGFGGILASIAGGVGGGMLKIAEEGWKKESEDRKYQFLKEKQMLDHENDIELENLKNKNKISQASIIAQQKTAKPTRKEQQIIQMGDMFKAIELNNEQIAKLNESLADRKLSKEEIAKLQAQKQDLITHNQTIAQNSLWGEVKKGTFGQQVLSQYNTFIKPFLNVNETKKPSVPIVEQPTRITPKADQYGEDIWNKRMNGESPD